MTSVVERVAKAIADKLREIGDSDMEASLGWLEFAEGPTFLHGVARAALEEMKHPTKAMLEAGMDYDERELVLAFGRAPTPEECQAGEFAAMIDIALRETVAKTAPLASPLVGPHTP